MIPKKDLRKAINEKCKQCIYDNLDVGTWRQQVAECKCDFCPLHPYRPMPTVGKRGSKNQTDTTLEVV